jgi:hypothetical protein
MRGLITLSKVLTVEAPLDILVHAPDMLRDWAPGR